MQASFRGLLKEGQLEDRQATFELPASASRVQPYDGMGGIAVHELISGYSLFLTAAIMLHYVTVEVVLLIGLEGICRTDCSG